MILFRHFFVFLFSTSARKHFQTVGCSVILPEALSVLLNIISVLLSGATMPVADSYMHVNTTEIIVHHWLLSTHVTCQHAAERGYV